MRARQSGGAGPNGSTGTAPPDGGELDRRSWVDRESLGPGDRVAPTWTEPLVRKLSRPFGGPLGRHAQVGRQWFWTPLRVVLLLATLTLAAGWLFKAPCLQTTPTDQGAVVDWSDERQYTAMCYTDIIPRYGVGDLAPEGAFPYKTSWVVNAGTAAEQVRYMEYPVLAGLFQWVNAELTDVWMNLAEMGVVPGEADAVVYFNITAFWLACAWLVTIWALSRLCGTRLWDTALAAISPLVFVHAFTNFDALATMFASTGLLAWSKRRPGLAGLLLGIGAATKLFPLFLLGPALVLGARSGKLRYAVRALGTAIGAWLAVNLPIMLLYPRGWWEFVRYNSARPADPDSLYNVIMYFTGWQGFDAPLRPDEVPVVLNAVSLTSFVLACAAIGWLAMAAPARPRLAQLCFLVVALFLLTNKVWSPQYSLWLVPLAVLAVPRWRLLVGWMIVDAAIWAPRMYYYLGTDDMGLPQGWFLGAIVVRDAVVIAVCVVIVREILRPSLDKVRTSDAAYRQDLGSYDPHGGVIDGAPDRFVLPGLARWGENRARRTARERLTA